jgi:predicted alpha/beta superfamily hydrolase
MTKTTVFLRFLLTLPVIAVLFVLIPTCVAQTVPESTSLTVNSQILGETQKAFVYLPKDYEKSEKRYPVVYLLDGDYNFSFTADAVKTLSSWTQRMPAAIVVGISSNKRDRDLTPKPAQVWRPPQPLPAAGGADRFLEYLTAELIPTIEKNYRTEPLRTLIGHSLGGLFAVHTFSAKPDLFRFYVLLDSSIWWDDGRVARRAIKYLQENPGFKGRIVWVRDKIPREIWFPINTEFLAFLENKRPQGLNFTFLELENETHSSIVFPGTYFGLREIFADYSFRFQENTDLQAVQNHFDKLRENYGYQIAVPEAVFRNLSGQLLYLKKNKEAIVVGERWIRDYPKSSEAYETLGKASAENGDRGAAARYLSKAVELNPENSAARQLLTALEKK